MGTVILHVGPHKTGTTAIQKTLHSNTGALANAGFVYPEIGFQLHGHHKLTDYLAADDADALAAAGAQLQAYTDRVVVLSSENFSRLSRPALDNLASLLSGYDDVRVILYLRSFLELFYPWWQEMVKHRLADDFGGFLAGCLTQPFRTHLLDAAGIIRRMARVFGASSISIYRYETVMRAYGDAARHFMTEVLDLREYEPDAEARSINKSMDHVLTEIIRCLNRTGQYGVKIWQEDARVRLLSDQTAERSAPYAKIIEMNYDQFVPHQLERNLMTAIRDLRLTVDPDVPVAPHSPSGISPDGWIFERREHEITYLDPSIWLFEAELAAQLRDLVAEWSGRGEP